MRRRKLFLMLVGLTGVVAAGVVALRPNTDRITTENYERIEIGMTRRQVEAILGPPGDYRTCLGETGFGEDTQSMAWVPDPAWFGVTSNWDRFPSTPPTLWASWVMDSFQIDIFIDDGQVYDKQVLTRRKQPGGQFDNFLWRAKRQWHRWFPE
jgi:hypothetical protein